MKACLKSFRSEARSILYWRACTYDALLHRKYNHNEGEKKRERAKGRERESERKRKRLNMEIVMMPQRNTYLIAI